jgi:hypothetical protein
MRESLVGLADVAYLGCPHDVAESCLVDLLED